MVLWSPVRANAQLIGNVDVQRLNRGADGGMPQVGELCRYRWVVDTAGQRAKGELEHPYGSWITLYLAVLEAAREQLPELTVPG